MSVEEDDKISDRTMQNSSALGHLPEFSSGKSNFEVYVERFEAFATANKNDLVTKQQVFLMLIGEAAFITLRNLLFPIKPVEATHDDIVKILLNHYAPRRRAVVERYKFYRRDQRHGEKISDFVVEIRKLAATCDFGTFLEEVLRDRPIMGLQNDGIRCKLLATSDNNLTLGRAFNSVLGMEAVQGQSKEVRRTEEPSASTNVQEDVNWQRRSTQRQGKKNFPVSKTNVACTRCSNAHNSKVCLYLKKKCFKCSRPGHIAKMCRTSIKAVTAVEKAVKETELFEVKAKLKANAYCGSVMIDGKQVEMQVDTGSAVSIMSKSAFCKTFGNKRCKESNVRLKAYNGLR
ncbi:uncharacterized protein LOC121047557 [Ixodes scapularis]|uniref:uncharacterized protein LOC121047557 n=1 Tax=Ixodes scapularis TaxID=6945 RepID=UPI001AD60650|nr:uncharacterized protein LOC121047557 [Ixodes scapularis]